MTTAAFLINPLSNTVATRGSVLARANSLPAKTYTLDSFDDLPDFVTKIADANTEIVFIEGGDGTIHSVLTEFLDQQQSFNPLPQFVLMPGGTTNLVAKQIGMKRPSIKKVAKILTAPKVVTRVDIPLLNLKYANEERQYKGFLFSTGALVSATSYTLTTVYKEGILGSAAVRTTLRRVLFGGPQMREKILKVSPATLEIGKDSVTDIIDGNHILCLATTLQKPLIGFSPFWGQEGGPLRISHVQAGAKYLIRNVSRFIKSAQTKRSRKILARDGYRSWAVNNAQITHAGPIVLDGEFLPQTSGSIALSTTQPLTFLS
ncbi:MAG: diacylglycerol kinase family protein [Robiginitomaculum sp.]